MRERISDNLGAIPQEIDERDTDPDLFRVYHDFGGPGNDDTTAPRCISCGRSSFDVDDAFERGILFCLREVQSLYQQKMSAAEAEHLVAWLRSKICPGPARTTRFGRP